MKTISKGLVMVVIMVAGFFAPYSVQSISTQVNTASQSIGKSNYTMHDNGDIVSDKQNTDTQSNKIEMLDIPISHYIENGYGSGKYIKYSSITVPMANGKEEYASKYKIIIPGYTYYMATPDKKIIISSDKLGDIKFDLYYNIIAPTKIK